MIVRLDAQRGGCDIASAPRVLTLGARTDYWTVMVPFMFIATCGVQLNSYLPAGIFANETT